jgi:hypothetical protein
MAVVGGVVLAQKLFPPHAAVDVPLAQAIVGSESPLSSDDGKERR